MKIQLDFEHVFPKGAYLAEVRPWYEYKDGKRTDQQVGLTYIFVNRAGYDKVNIKVKSLTEVISNEEIEASTTDISVKADGFVGTVYNVNGNIAISGTAEKVVVL